MITMKEARRIHRNTMTQVVQVQAGWHDPEGNMMYVAMRISRVPYREWARLAWRLDLASLNEAASPKLHRIVFGGA